jgi:hypothetical protein
MQVRLKHPWTLNRSKVVELEQALAPESRGESGIAENAREHCEDIARSVGCILAKLVEKNLLTLEEARVMSGNLFWNMELIEDGKDKSSV